MTYQKNFEHLKDQIKNLDIFNIINEDTNYIKSLSEYFKKFENIIVFGTGGSSLGGKALVNFHSSINGIKPKVQFIENTDSRSFLNQLNACNKKTTGIIVISKSGKTTEILMLFLSLCELWKDFDFQSNAIVITENSPNNDLRLLAESKSIKVFDHPKNIGGRFSVFSIVGLLPASIQGFDIDEFIKGAKKAVHEVVSEKEYEKCHIFNDIITEYEAFESKIDQHVLLIYSDFLTDLGKWFAQLTGESLGKTENFGITPVITTGTVDQHSMLQLFLGGPANKFYTVITQKNNSITPKIMPEISSPVINEIKNKSINDLMTAHQKATIDVLRKKSKVRVLDFEEFNEFSIGYMMMLFFMEIVTIAEMAKINPFDQPAVEESKKLAMKYLSYL